MRRWVIPALVLADVALLVLLASLWLHRDGRVRAVQWNQPAAVPVALDPKAPLPATDVDLSRYVAILERPLFVPSRRPPPPPPPPAPPKVAETLPTVRILGVYGVLSEEDGASAPSVGPAGLIARIDGAVRRLRVGDRIGGWSVERVRRNEVVLAQGSERQTIAVRRGQVDDAVAAAGGVPGGASRPAADPNDLAVSRAAAEAVRAKNSRRIREMNGLRARSGLPPLPEP